MKLITFYEHLQRIVKHAGSRLDTMNIGVVISQPGTIGGTPIAKINSVIAGFDWDANKVLISTEPELHPLTIEEKRDISSSVKNGQSWHADQQYRKLRGRIADLEKQLAAIGVDSSECLPQDIAAASRILTSLGFSQEPSMEPGVDIRRDRVAGIIAEERRRIFYTEGAEDAATGRDDTKRQSGN